MLFASIGCADDTTGGSDAAAGADLAAKPDLATKLDAGSGGDGAAHMDLSVGSDASASGLTLLRSFDGDSGLGASGRGKPEMNVAANGTQVAQITWQNLSVYDYAGTLAKSVSLATLITNAGLNPQGGKSVPFEPHIIYDEFIQRWVVTATCLYDCVLVSDGADPTGTWKGFYLDGNGNDPAIHLAYDKNGVYFDEAVLANQNPDTPCCSTSVFAIPGAELQWTNALNPTHRNKQIGKPHELMLVTDHDPNKAPGAAAFSVARTCPGGNCQGPYTNQKFQWIVSYGTWAGTTFTMTSNHTSLCAGGAAPADQCVRTDPDGVSDRWLFNTPIDPNQPGTNEKLRGAEIHRILDGMQQGSHVQVVFGSGPCLGNCGAHGPDQGADILLWADLDCSALGACKVGQTQKVSGADHLLWPSVGVDPSGNVGIVANVVNSAMTYLSVVAFDHRATDPAGMLTGPTMVIAGTTPFVCSLGANNTAQTGNPVGVSTLRDPLDPTALWVSEQYASDAGDCHWDTRIVQYRP